MKVYKVLDKFECIKNIIVCAIAIPVAVSMIISVSMMFTDPEASETTQTALGAVRFVFTSVMSLIIVLVLFLLAQHIFKLIVSSDGEEAHIDGLRRFEVGKQIIGGAIGIYVWGLFIFFGSLIVFPDIMPGNVTNTEEELASLRIIGIIFMLMAVGASVVTIIKTVSKVKKARAYYSYENFMEMRRKIEEAEQQAASPAEIPTLDDSGSDNPFI